MPDPDCDIERVLQDDAVNELEYVVEIVSEFDTVLHPDCVKECVPQDDAEKETVPVSDTVGDVEYDVESVGDLDRVPEPDCDKECVPHDDAEKETEALPDRVADDDEDGGDEPDALSDQLFELQPDGEYELVSVGEIVGDVDTVPDTD